MLKNNKGLTLIEILVAMTLMFTAVFCFTPLMLSSIDALVLASDGREEMYSEKASLEENLADGVTIKDEGSFDGFTVTFNQDSNSQHSSVKGQYINSDNNKLNTFIGRDIASMKISPDRIPPNPPYLTEFIITCDNIIIDDVTQFQLLEDGVLKSGPFFGDTDKPNHLAGFTTDPITDANTTTHIYKTTPDNNPYKAYMYRYSTDPFDPTKEYVVKYGNMEVELEILPSSIFAVGDGGHWASYDGGTMWKVTTNASGNGIEWFGENGTLSSTNGPALRDIVWTGSQYVVAGDKGAFWYTNEDAEWVQKKPDNNDTVKSKTYYKALEINGEDIYVSGHVINGGSSNTGNANRITEQTISSPTQLSNVLGLNFTYGTAIATAKLGSDVNKLFANKSYVYTYRTSTIAIGKPGKMFNTDEDADTREYVQFAPEDVVLDIKHNGYTNSSGTKKSEVIAVCESGKIYSSTNGGKSWTLNSDNGTKTTTSVSVPTKYYYYTAEKAGSTIYYDNPIFEIRATDTKYTPSFSSGEPTITYSGTKYTLYSDGTTSTNNLTVAEYNVKTKYSDAVIIDVPDGITNKYGLRAVEYGETDANPNGIWVAGGDVNYITGKGAKCTTNRETYRSSNVYPYWYYYGYPATQGSMRKEYKNDDTRFIADKNATKQRTTLLWRDATETGAGNWHPAIVHLKSCTNVQKQSTGDGSYVITKFNCTCVDKCTCSCDCDTKCGAINDILFINGKFYAVGDVEIGSSYNDIVLESEDGKFWVSSHKGTWNTAGTNLYAIAGYEWQN